MPLFNILREAFFVLNSPTFGSTLQVLKILAYCAEQEINVYIAKQQMLLDGSMQSKITATELGLVVEINCEWLYQVLWIEKL